MDGPNKPCFQSVVILGLKSALFEAQDEINRLTRERDEARKKILQMIQTNGKFQVEVIKSNELATKLKTELKKVRKELEDRKMKLDEMREENERDSVNWSFKCNELKSLLDIKTELLESLNIKGDRANKDESIDYRANYKMLMKNLKVVIKNRLCFPDHELIEDIRNIMLKAENGKSVVLLKYLAKRTKPVQKKPDECCHKDDEKNMVEILDDSRNQMPTSMSLLSCFTNNSDNCSENLDPNTLQSNSSTKVEDLSDPNSIASTNTNLVREKTIEICDELRNEPCSGVTALNQNDEKDIDAISDSESDSTSGFCDGDTEVESPSNIELASHPRSTSSPENLTLAMCMPDLSSLCHIEKNTPKGECCTKSSIDYSNINSDPSVTVLNSKLENDIKSQSSQKKKSNFKNDHDVRTVLEEMKQMRNAMIEKVSSLKQFHDVNLIETNNCFKRPESVPFSHRKSIKKIRKNIEDQTDFIPKRSTQLVKRDPCCRKPKSPAISSAIYKVSDAEPDKKPEVGLSNEINEIQEDSFRKSNSISEALDLTSTKKLQVYETSSVENDSLLSNVTSCFKEPIETATESPQLITEVDVRDTIIDLKNESDEVNFSESDNQVAVEEIENTLIFSLQNSVSETTNSTAIQLTELLENPRLDTLLSIEPTSNSNGFVKSNSVKKLPDLVATEENPTASTECIVNVSSDISPFSTDVTLEEVLREENYETDNGFTNTISSGIDMSDENVISAENSTKESPSKAVRLKEVSCSDKRTVLSTCLENDLTNDSKCNLESNNANVISGLVQKRIDDAHGASISATVVDVDIVNRSSVDLYDTTKKNDSPNTSGTSEQQVDSSVSKPKKVVTASRKSVPKKNVSVDSPTNSNTTNKEILKKPLKKRGRPKKASLDLGSEDDSRKSTGITQKSENLSTSTPNMNIAISQNLNELRVPKTNSQTNSPIDCDLAKEKILEKVPKKRGRPKKSSLYVRDELDSDDTEKTSRGSKSSQNSSASRSKKKDIISETLNESSVLENNAKSNAIIDCDSTERKMLENKSKKRRHIPPRKVSSVTKSKPQNTSNSTEPKTDDFKTTRSGRRWCSIDPCETKPVIENVASSNTMNNGMQRRKRKGKYPDILDSLKSKSKRLKSDYNLMSRELNEVIKPNQRRGRKRKTSLPVETFDSATQTNWSPRSESAIPHNTNNIPEIESNPEATLELDVAIKNNQRIEQPSPVKTNIEKPISTENVEILTNFARSDIVAQSGSCTNVANCPLPSSCHLVTSSRHNLLHQLIDDMSKIIREKVSSIVMDKSVVLEHENLNHLKSISIAVNPSLVCNSSTKPNNSEEFVSSTNELEEAISVTKLKEEYVLNPQNSSEVLENDEESSPNQIVKTASQPEVTSVEVSSHSSSEMENDARPMKQPETIFIAELRQKQVSNSFDLSTKPDNGEKSVAKSDSPKNRTSTSESGNDESITKTSTQGRKRTANWMANLSSESQSEEESVPKSTMTVPKSERPSVDNLASETENHKTSIFNFEDDKSQIEISFEKISSPKQQVPAECKHIDSDDDSPVEISSKIVTRRHGILRDADQYGRIPEIISKVRCEEEASNTSSLSSQVSDLDANTEMISQFENIRTPPKVKNLFDSSDDENSKSDVFAIIEEMTSVSRCLFERQKELAEFSRSSSPLLKSEVVSPSEVDLMYSPSRNEPINELQIKDEDDSEDETLIIAEDDQVNDSTGDGIEIDKFNFQDTNDSYASPAYSKSFDYGQLSSRVAIARRIRLDDSVTKPGPKTIVENENQTKANNLVRFQFYKENLQLEDNCGAAKALSPFDSVWDTIKSLYVKSSPVGDDVLLIPCYKSVTHLAFFHTKRQKDSKKQYFSIEQDKIAHVENLIKEYLENVRENEYVAVKNFKIATNASPITIAISLTNTVLKNANRRMKELMITLGYLSNLCVDLEIDHKDFLSIMQTNLKNKMFSKTWQVDKNSDTNQVTCIIAMSVLFTMLSQRSNDVKSVRDLLLEGLCSWKYRGHPVAFGVLTACPTIFNGVSRNCLLTRVILFTLINHSMERNLELYKVPEVREMINQYYNVKLGDKAAEDYVKEAMLLFNDDTWVDAMVLLCKRKGFSWAYTNVIMKYLIQIVNKWKECDFNETILIKTIKALHKVVQSCPSKAVNNLNKTKGTLTAVPKYHTYNIGSIIESLSEVLHGPKSSRELRETVAVAICNISHLNFEVCSNILSKWIPPESAISSQTLEEMNEIMKRCRVVAPNVPNRWLRTILPKECITKKYNNRRNFTPRTFERANGGDSTLQQQRQRPSRLHVENTATNEPPKKKKNKGKKNRNSRKHSVATET